MNEAPDQRGCDYCGLPVGGRADGSSGPHYCCYGCRFAASITGATGDDGQARWMMTRLGLAVFFSMNVMVFTLLLWSQPDGETGGAAADAFYGLARHLCLLMTVPVLALLGGPLLDDAWSELRRGRPSLNLLLVAGVAAAFAISAWATWRGVGHVYFEVACMVPVAVTLGRWLEATGKLRTTEALRALKQVLPDRVRLVEPDAQAGLVAGARPADRETPLAEVRIGDRLRILPGEHVPTDGCIVGGTAALDERAVTGESEPVVKRAGAAVYSGTLDLDGELIVEVTAAPGAGTLERLVDAVTAAASASRAQRLADSVSAWFLPVVLVAAAATTLVHGRLSGWPDGVMAGLAVVVVACPCALGLATPMALWAAAGMAARRHVLVRDGDALERLATADVFCFDKTGTLTTGSRVTVIGRAGGVDPCDDVRAPDPEAIAAALAAGSTHVHAAAIAAAATARGVAAVGLVDVRTVPGHGVEGMIEAASADPGSDSMRSHGDDAAVPASPGAPPAGVPHRVRLGRVSWAFDRSHDASAGRGASSEPILGARGRWHPLDPAVVLPVEEPRCVLSIDGEPSLAFWMAEDVRREVPVAVKQLRHRGRTIILSGDQAARVAAVAEPLGIEWQAPLLPAGKLEAIAALRREGRRVVMIGDGINDAPALAAADVGVALGCGADVARWSAGICLLRDDLAALPWLTDLAIRTRRTIRWNLLWAFGYNAACIPLAAAGLVHPAVAAVAMVVSSLLVVGNSLRLAAEEPDARDVAPMGADVPADRHPAVATAALFAAVDVIGAGSAEHGVEVPS